MGGGWRLGPGTRVRGRESASGAVAGLVGMRVSGAGSSSLLVIVILIVITPYDGIGTLPAHLPRVLVWGRHHRSRA